LAAVLIPLIHGLYDFGMGGGVAQLTVLSLMLTLLLTLGLFLYFMEANVLDRAALARIPMGLVRIAAQPSGQPAANFCINCGRSNAKRQTYCESCGRKL
jgi:hypothetical protein